jgi:RHS repeat-associated protein
MSRARLVPALMVLFTLSPFVPAIRAQITNVTNDTSTPIEGAGHDYIHMLSETVNPASGSVSLRINLPVPQARRLTIPFSISYDSNTVHHLVASSYPQYGVDNWASNTGYLSQGGWSYSIPQLGIGEFTQNTYVISGYNGSQPIYNIYPCYYASNYVFRDASASLHSLYLGSDYATNSNGDGPQYCTLGGPVVNGGDVEVTAKLTGPVGVGPGPAPLPVTVSDGDGTVYYFSSAVGVLGNPATTYSLPSSIEDRNGNIVAVAASGNWPSVLVSLTDTVGRPAVSIAGFGPSGTTNTVTTPEGAYQVTWKTTSASFTVPTTWVGPSGSPNSNDQCTSITAASDSQTVISQITLPNGQGYHFYYGTDNPNPGFQNPYGMLSEIDYPSGGWVRYTWKLSDTMNELADYPGVVYNAGTYCGSTYTGCPVAVPDGCLYQYKTPVVASRQVGFSTSSTAALVQTFTYSTTWAAPVYQNVGGTSWTVKTTDATTTDNVANQSFLTAYTYTPITIAPQPFSNTDSIRAQMAVEQTTSYYNSTSPTSPLRTVTKSWLDQFRMQNQQITLDNGVTSQVNYTWTSDNITEKDEYDFGQSSASRKTITNFQSFAATPGNLLDRPCQIITEDGSSNHYAETDYFYDGGTSTCGTAGTPTVAAVSNLPPGTHDETYFGPTKTTPRGNATSVTKLCIAPACSGGNSTTTYTYDETGQVLSKVDPCGNATCSDMSGTSHTTSYSYADSYTTLSGGQNVTYTPSGNTNAYLTKITNPLAQTQSFTYDHNNGQLTVSKDQNNLTTTYLYNDSLARPTLLTFPDGGSTSVAYSDTPPSPTVTTSKKINSTTSISSVALFDGLGHLTETELTSDPQGTVYTNTAYDGFGRTHTVSNPYRSGSDPTTSAGTTTYAYDGIGRKITETYPDTSVLQTAYCGPNTLVTDPVGKWRRSRVDGLARLVEVDEPNATGATVTACPGQSDPIWITSYTNDPLSNLTQVVQNGSHTRIFTYDSFSRLICSSNPESNTALCPTPDPGTYTTGTTRYTYDANSNVSTKKDARAITTTYGYEPLNRETSRSYSNGDPTVTTTYDQSTCLGLAACQNIGHVTSVTDAAGSDLWAYETDPTNLRSVHANQRTTSNVTKTTTYILDLAGNTTQITYPTGRVINSTFDAANRPATAADSINGVTYAAAQSTPPTGCLTTGVCYTPQGTEYGAAIGKTSTFSGINLSETYNTRLQPLEIKASSSAGSAFDITYSFVDLATTKNAGHVNSITNNLNASRSQSFSYDQLNRVVTAGTGATTGTYCWGYQYNYDAWANLLAQAGWSSKYTGCSEATMGSVTANGSNQISGFTYDASGNTQNDGTIAYSYNAESQMKTAAGATYAYDGSGRRVSKSNGKLYWYSAGDEILAETDLSGNTLNEYVFFGGKRIALVSATGGTALPVQNASFEIANPLTDNCGANCYYNTGPVPDWTFSGTGGNGSFEPNSSYFNLPLPDGNVVASLNAGSSTQTLTGVNFLPNTTYTLSAYVGHRLDGYVTGYTVALQAGSSVLNSVSGSSSTITAGDFAHLTVTYSTGSTPPSGYVTIVLTSAGSQSNFDNVSLTTSGGIYYYVEDMLGTSRVMTQANGTVCYDADFDPYGGEHPYTDTCPQSYKFEGKERDTETGNDDFGARYYSNRFGRWLSADWSSTPVAVPYANLTNPQTLNLYAMVSDDPESFADLNGHCDKDGKGHCFFQKAWNWVKGDGFKTNAQLTPQGSVTIVEHQRVMTPGEQKIYNREMNKAIQNTMLFVPMFAMMVNDSMGGDADADADTNVTPEVEGGAAQETESVTEENSGGNVPAKPDTRPTNPEKNTLEGAQDQYESISKAQSVHRAAGRSHAIEGIGKSMQRLKNALKNIVDGKEDADQ